MSPFSCLATVACLLTMACTDNQQVASANTQDKKPPEGYNRLYFETSPYLKLHEKNPVDWYPWSKEAFDKAKNEDKLIFLSIGYSTCHWCHVMEEECFANQDVADALNANYVSIKVDREQMPDIDHVYMQVTQAMTGRGGWPNTLLLTPEKKPVFAGTYIPREPLIQLLTEGKRVWDEERDALLEQGDLVAKSMREYLARTNSGIVTDANVHIAASKLMETYDEDNGGFSDKPKFPSPINLLFMLRAAERTGNESYKNAALNTLTKMRHGGIYDQVGFGFHRYSVDEFWRVPHFEKMLYDQATHVLAYTEAHQVTQDPMFKRTAEEILTYVTRDMSDKEGGFWSAQDADSEGEEGKFYVWTDAELKIILTAEEFNKAKKWFMTTKDGNFLDEATKELTGSNIFELEEGTENSKEFHAIRSKLLVERIKRIPPLTDDKVLTDWNGLMIAAYARAGVAFDEPKWIERAQKAVRFIRSNMLAKDGTLSHSYREGKIQGTGQLKDYASVIWGLIELYEADFSITHLELATELAETIKAKFHDENSGGFYMTAEGQEVALARAKTSTDGALPSGNALAAYSLVKLGRILANTEYEELGKSTVEAFGGDIERAPSAFVGLLLATDFLAGPTTEVVVVGERKEALEMIRKMQSIYSPRTVFILKDPSDADQLTKLAKYTESYTSQDGRATAYVCQNYTCELPTTDVASALASIKRANQR